MIQQEAQKDSILIVDDNLNNLRVLGNMLEQSGLRVRLADNGSIALHSCSLNPPKLILLDIRMPEMDGYEVCRRLKANNATCNIPVIFISALHGVADKIAAFKAGGRDYISKPFNSEEVLARVQTHLELYHLQCHLEQLVAERTQKQEQTNQELQILLQKHIELESELKLASKIIKSTNQAIVITDLQTRIIDVNQAYCDMFGYTAEELLGNKTNFLNSGRHDNRFFQDLWGQIQKNGTWFGEIWNRKKDGEILPTLLNITVVRDTNNKPSHYAGIQTDIKFFKTQEDKLLQLAYFDPLTGLPNRTLMHDRMQQSLIFAKRNQEQIALLFLDLDGFKKVNDTLGHWYGDNLLEIVAKRLSNYVRKNDTVSRLGGDEFIIVLNHLQSQSDAATISENIIKYISTPLTLNHQTVKVGISIGISLYPSDANDSETLLKYADDAMYLAKKNGKGRYEFYSNTSDTIKKDELES